ncbi:hypothetical protein HPB47_009950 [Ixodes persulcatus]|uniref:Uncharacterized protein n=1 Tax=Ixodes persulcatus TaxID=34615 RepID=A0AC60P0E3_IXOPE|nr:hypothetical protein HPB47_009950 [Ixodes persulcatus]
MSTLAEYQWLNDKVAAEGHSVVRRWSRKMDLFSYDIVLVPLHFTMHWRLATIDFRKKHIAYRRCASA